MSGAVDSRQAVHRVFDRRLSTAFPFVAPLVPATAGGAAPDLVFTRRAPLAAGGVDWSADRVARLLGADVRLGRRGPETVLRCDGGRIDFRLAGDGRRIEAHAAAEEVPDWLVELRFLAPVMAMWLELAGIVTFHAAAVAVGERAVALLAGGRAGKTTLAAALVSAGHPLLADDLVAVEEGGASFRVLPSYPFVRLEVGDAARWTGAAPGDVAELPRAHPDFAKRIVPVGGRGVSFGRFRDRPARLTALVLPQRRPPGGGPPEPPRLDPVPPAEGLVLLAGLSAVPRLAAAAGLAERRLALLARLVEGLPLWRLRYDDGHQRLPEVVGLLVDALAESG